MNKVVVSGSFDDLRSRQVSFLEEAARLGPLSVLLYSDECVQAQCGQAPKFPQAEREYFVQAMRYVNEVKLVNAYTPAAVFEQAIALKADVWAVDEAEGQVVRQAQSGIALQVIKEDALAGFALAQAEIAPAAPGGPRKVVVSGCYDWLHSGHVRFFEEVSGLGDLYVVVGNDANVQFLKGAGHPLFRQDERRYMVQSVLYVKQAFISSGWDWLDYAPEVKRIAPDMFAVNEDGDKPEKRQFCQEQGIEYVVLKRTPKAGLPRRESTKLRGF
jgi:cytidyltransferase-like protein